jgi:hypothetical protein
MPPTAAARWRCSPSGHREMTSSDERHAINSRDSQTSMPRRALEAAVASPGGPVCHHLGFPGA